MENLKVGDEIGVSCSNGRRFIQVVKSISDEGIIELNNDYIFNSKGVLISEFKVTGELVPLTSEFRDHEARLRLKGRFNFIHAYGKGVHSSGNKIYGEDKK